MAKAMNKDFEPKLRHLFNAECQAATNAIETGNQSDSKKFLK